MAFVDVEFQAELKTDSDVQFVLSQCAQRMYLLKLLCHQWMSMNFFQLSSTPPLSQSILYALPVWSGFLSGEHKNTVNASGSAIIYTIAATLPEFSSTSRQKSFTVQAWNLRIWFYVHYFDFNFYSVTVLLLCYNGTVAVMCVWHPTSNRYYLLTKLDTSGTRSMRSRCCDTRAL